MALARRKEKRELEIPTDSVSDIAFLLIIFFILTTTLSKLTGFTAGRWRCPLLLRAPSGAGYGDGGQHGQSLWGTLAAIPLSATHSLYARGATSRAIHVE